MGVGSELLALVFGIEYLLAYSALYSMAPFHISFEWWMLPGLLVAQDFFYYWKHRSHHVIRMFRASHVVHHSSKHFNLSTALRQSWFNPGAWIFYASLVLAGFHPAAVIFCQSLNLMYQFLVHTERVDKLARPIEFIMVTPSHHRVHHASQGSYLDRDFGGTLIIWDRLFGSFAAETETPRYGLTKDLDSQPHPSRVPRAGGPRQRPVVRADLGGPGPLSHQATGVDPEHAAREHHPCFPIVPSGSEEMDAAPGPDLFRSLLRRHAAGVVIVTAAVPAETVWRRAGFTATSFTSVSLDPPLVSFCVDRASSSWRVPAEAGHFGIHFLAESQEDMARTFAAKGADQFTRTQWRHGPHGAPLLSAPDTVLVRRVTERVRAGDHIIVLGS
ncbi:flavin reductase [Streptosporangium sp. G12]